MIENRFLDIAANTHREKDGNGFLIVRNNPIAKAGVFEYLLSEIHPNFHGTDGVVKVYRPFETLAENADSFANKPIMFNHNWIGDEGEKKADGAIGSNITKDAAKGYLIADLIIYNPDLIEKIERGEIVELSPAYSGSVEQKQGRHNGDSYEYIQNVDLINHLAVVENGRSGSDLRILDSKKGLEMAKLQKFKDELLKVLGKFADDDATDEVKAEDSEKCEDEEVKVEDSPAAAIAEILKGEGDADGKLAKIAELLGTADSESEEPKVEDEGEESEPKAEDEEPKIEDEGEDEKDAEKFADSISRIIDLRVRKALEGYKVAQNAENVKIQDSYQKVSRAIGSHFDYSGKSAEDIFKFGYEVLSGAKLGENMSAETAFLVASQGKKPQFKDAAPAKKSESKILKMLENL